MGFKSVVLVSAILACLAFQAIADDDIASDVRASFQNENLFNTSISTGMSPGVPQQPGVRTPVIAVTIAPVAGIWSLRLVDVGTSLMNLTLYQSLDAVYGNGTVSMYGGAPVQVTVSGTVLGDKLAIYVVPVGTPSLYRMSLTIGLGTLNGDYLYDSPGAGPQPGIANGKLLGAPQGLNQPQTYNGAYVQPVGIIPVGPKSHLSA